MYIKINKIEQIEEFKTDADLLVCKGTGSGRKSRTLFFFSKDKIIKLDDGVTGFQLKDNKIYYSNWNNESFQYNIINNERLKLDFEQISVYKLKDFVFFSKENNYHIISNSEYIITPEQLGNKNILNDLKIYCTNSLNDEIKSYNILKNGDQDWRINLNLFDSFKNQWDEEIKVEVKTFVGVWHNQLITFLNNGTFLGLSINTGQKIWAKNNVDFNDTPFEIEYGFGTSYNPILDIENGLIYILQGETFIEFDLNNNRSVYRWHTKQDKSNNHLFIKQSRLASGKIYFTAAKYPNLNVDSTIGIFDIKQKEIIWQFSFLEDSGIFIPNNQNNIQVNHNFLYVLDNKKNLHIFKTEKPIF